MLICANRQRKSGVAVRGRKAESVWARKRSCGHSPYGICKTAGNSETYLIRHMLDQLHPGWKDIGSRHFTAIAELAGKPVGSRLDLPGGLMARTGYETLEIVRKTEREVSVKTESGADGEIHGCQTVPELHMTVFPRQKIRKFPKTSIRNGLTMIKLKVRCL